MSKKIKHVMSRLLVFVMILQMAMPMSVQAATVEPAAGFTIEHVATGKLIKTYEENNTPLTVDGEADDPATVFSKAIFGICDNNVPGTELPAVTFISKEYGKRIKSAFWNNGATATTIMVDGGADFGGWESLQIVPNGDGTVSFKDSYFDEYITVADVEGKPCLKCRSGITKEQLTDNEKFIIHTDVAPDGITDLAVSESTRTRTTLDLTWTNPQSFYTGIQVFQKGPGEIEYTKIADLSDESSYQVTGLTPGSPYSFKVLVINGNGSATDTTISTFSNEANASTRAGEKPATPSNLKIEEKDNNKVEISWDAAENATHYQILRAESMFGTYDAVATVGNDKTSAEVEYTGSKYANYYRVVALNNGENGDEDFSNAEVSEQSDYTSLEKEMFGDHTLIFAPTDDTAKVDELLQKLFEKQNDSSADAQFKGEQWQVYFKPGDYTETSCVNIGFYTSINGLGKTPYDVKLNNIAVPDYLGGNNATCNFWRSAENLSIINTGNAQGKAQYGSWRGDWFNWAVAQAAPLRRVYSERPVAYDWNYGWASGGYVADCYFTGVDGEGNSAGTWSGQQFYTRNTKAEGNVFGTTLNNFYQGVEAPNLPDAEGVADGTSRELINGNGYSNWKIPNAKGEQQVFTNVEKTPEIAEKPFLYLDDNGEYQVFVPAVRKDTQGISWSEDDMGEGNSIPLSEFYVAKPTDTAAKINEQLAAGKNIYFTPGTYHAEEPIKVNDADTVLLGTGMASIIPTNGENAMEIADVDGVRVAGLIFDAGESSEYLLVVGEQGKHTDHSANPIILQDLFFRVGGTTDVLTKSDDALEINADDVIGDHFWIWRADHGAGVEWYGNESKHGLIVNGDDVTCYALFNEHFQEYHTLWNGENGATYFYQNETCYDPISQEAWMSHDGTVNGYASYKVADEVKNHYAIGLGIYNVFINAGPNRDSMDVQIQLDNAIEVPDTEGVLVENACLQTFANGDGALQKINSIVNGMGDPVSSGTDKVTGETGTSWDRSFLLYYQNGKTEGSSRAIKNAYKDLQDTYDKYKDQEQGDASDEDWEKFQSALNTVKDLLDEGVPVCVEWPVEEQATELQTVLKDLENAQMDLDATDEDKENAKADLAAAIAKAEELTESDYTEASWAEFAKALADAKALTEDAAYSEIVNATTALKDAQNALVTKAAQELADAKKALADALTEAEALKEADYTADSWAGFATALASAKETAAKEDATVEEVKNATKALQDAKDALVEKDGGSENPDLENAKKALADALTAAEALKEADYTVDSWAGFATALASAKETAAKEDATVEELTNATTALQDAQNALVTKAAQKLTDAKKALADELKSVESLKEADYTKESWTGFATALASAKEIEAKENATLEEVENATKALQDAKGKLVKVTVPDPGKPGDNTTPGGSTTPGDTTNPGGNTTPGDNVTIPAVEPSVKLNATSIPLQKGKTTTALKIVTKYPNDDQIVKWTSSNKKVVTVTNKGKIKAKKVGTAYVTVTMKSGATAKCKVKVQKGKVTTKKLTATSKNITVKVKGNIQLEVERNPITATEKITWSSSNKKVATVTNKGKVTGKKAGKATITAKTTNGKKIKFKVTVK